MNFTELFYICTCNEFFKTCTNVFSNYCYQKQILKKNKFENCVKSFDVCAKTRKTTFPIDIRLLVYVNTLDVYLKLFEVKYKNLEVYLKTLDVDVKTA